MEEDIQLTMTVFSGYNDGLEVSMPIDDKSTISDLHHFLQSKFPLRNVKIHVSDDKLISLCSHSIALLGEDKIQETFPFPEPIPISVSDYGPALSVLVKGLTSENLITLHSTDYIHLLKAIALQDEGTGSEDVKIRIEGSMNDLDGNMTLSEAGINGFSTVHVERTLKGGARMKSGFNMLNVFDDKAMVVEKFSSNGSDWNTVEPGLSIEGLCTNRRCKASNEDVDSNQQFGTFVLHTVDARCPECNYRIDVNNIGFSRCFYRILGRTTKKTRDQVIPWRKVGDVYQTWDPKKTEEKRWKILQITTRPLNLGMKVKGNEDVKEAPIEDTCVVCMKNMALNQSVQMLSCCHSFHRKCITRWRANEVTKKTGKTCPLCMRRK